MIIRKLAAITIFLAGITGAYFIVQEEKLSENKEVGGGETGSYDIASDGKGVYTKTSYGNHSAQNLTENALLQYSREVVRANEGADIGASGFQPKLPEDEILSSIIETEIGKGIGDGSEYELKDIKTNENSVENLSAYLNGLSEIHKKHYNAKSSEDFLTALARAVAEEDGGHSLRRNLNVLSDEITELLALPAPQNWAEFHLEFINIREMKLEIGKAMLKSNDDPLLAIAATKEVSPVFEREIALMRALENNIIPKNER